MTKYNQRKKKSSYKFWHSPVILGLLFCVLLLFAYNMVGLIQKEQETTKNKLLELKKIDELRKREATLLSDIDTLNTPEGIERSVRDKFQVVKPGEKEVLIIEEDRKEILDPVSEHSFWNFIKRMFNK